MEFVAPEIIKGEDYDTRADIYSLGKIMEFIGERNITKQYNSVATHCTQFSKEQRFDSISEVRSAVGKGRSVVKIILFVIVAAVVGALLFLYVPKIKANVEKERAERRAVEFKREVERIQGQLPELCKKYEMKSFTEPLTVDWSEDSLQLAQGLVQYLALDEYKDRAMQVLDQQRVGIEKSRQAEFENLLLCEFKSTNDSLAVVMRSALVEPTDAELLDVALEWFERRR
jgi:serine/threonine protein kinase